ncbi:MAG TPA: addiction module protein [Saprospiraceae bacterium]|nr:addiction module protein [Saprospiraceae bacterium]
MPRSKSQLFKEALQLDARDKADLAGILLESLDVTEHGDAEQLWLREVERRLSEIEENPQVRISWETVSEELRKHTGIRG